MPRFVILEHHHQGVHWDFMLEAGESLRTWRLAAAPVSDAAIAATPLPDHRRMYLDYEGEISGGRGHVTRWDWGEFDWVIAEPSCVAVSLRGRRLAGCVHLRGGDSGDWSFRLIPPAGGAAG